MDESAAPIIYHYCSLESFLSIVQSKCLRLSDINTLNDFGEMHWAYDKFIQAINAQLDEYDRKFFDDMDKVVSRLQVISLPLISSFSTEADMLSQWRGYAENGSGVALGLDAALVKGLAVRCGQVVYDEKEQLDHFRKLFSVMNNFWQVAEKNPDLKKEFRELLFILAFDMCLMKNPAFSEEKEVRLIRATAVEWLDDGRWSLTDSEGGSNDALSSAKQQIYYRARSGGLVAYIDLPLAGLGSKLIKEVVLGPRSLNNGVEVSMALTAQGFTDFKIRKSTATFR